MKAKEIMSKEICTLTPETTIGEAMQVLIEKAISGAPVLDKEDNILGVVTEKDLLVAYDLLKRVDEPIESFMSKEVINVEEETPIEVISQMLVQRNIKRVPVLAGKKVLGVISRRDVLKFVLGKNK